MFANLKIKHDEIRGYDEASFDASEPLMNRLWAIFVEQCQCVQRVGELDGLSMWDGEKDIWLGIEAIGGAINISMDEGRCYVCLYTHYNPLDVSERIEITDNWVRFASIMRWLKNIMES